MTDAPDRADALNAAKLRALVRGRWGLDDGHAGTFPGGATLRSGRAGWVLVGTDPARRLGGAMAWARQHGLDDLHVLSDDLKAAGVLARRAGLFTRPPTVWRVDGATLSLATAAAPPEFPAVPPTAELFRPVLRGAGVEVVTEQGELIAEVKGLEVARVVDGGEGDGGGARLEVGVGRFDREAFALMNEGVPDAQALQKAVDVVRPHRRPGAPHHQLNQLGRERWLRADLVADPARIGAAELRAIEPALPRANLKDPAPASALGTLPDGRRVVVTCSTGVDLDLVPSAADDRLAHAPGAELILAVPERDVLAVTEALALALVQPATVVAVEGAWSTDSR